MFDKLTSIKSPVSKELQEFEKFFHDTMKSKIPLLDTILKFLVKRKGKQIRPVFVLLSAALHGNINEKTYRGASLIELLHTATLIHDDVVDDSFKRRGVFTINALWKNKTAVLVGDYLLSRGMLLALTNQDHYMLEITSDAVRLMSEGELLQIEKARTLDIQEDIYYEVIRMKTASLIATSCAIGAASVEAPKEDIQKMWDFGESVGMAFQIKDDLLDYASKGTGKSQGMDIKEKKLTLPLIYALKQSDKKEKRHILNLISSSKVNKENMSHIIDFINQKQGFLYAQSKMEHYKSKASTILLSYPDSPYKLSLSDLLNYIIERKM